MSRRLYRSRTNKVIAGICGGLGEHLDIDPTLVRLIAVVSLLGYGLTGFLYLIAWVVVPRAGLADEGSESTAADPFAPKTGTNWKVYLPGIILIALGVMFLLPEYIPGFEWVDIWPIILVLLGLTLILRSGRATTPPPVPPVDGPGSRHRDGGMQS